VCVRRSSASDGARSAQEMIGSMTERLREGRVAGECSRRGCRARLAQRITQLEGREATLESELLS
jgi:hypothetical protein